VIHGPTAGRHWEASAARKQLHRTAASAGVRRRFAPHQLRHAHAVEMAHEGVPLVVIQRQLGNTPTSASPASICRASTAARSSAPSTAGHRRRSPQAPGSSVRDSSGCDWIGQASAWPIRAIPWLANLRSLSVADDRPCLRVPHGYFTGENRDLMALDQARGVLERLRRSRSPVRERVRQCSRRLGLEVRQNVPLGSRWHPSWASRRAGHLVRVAHRRVAHRPRDPAGDPKGTGAPLPITRFA
jgi:Phage integrase family